MLTATSKLVSFKRIVTHYYRSHGRSLPWRENLDPYAILVSEIMLQQTQVDRVIPKYAAFLKKFPTVQALARAPLAQVLRSWQGLGYNRRGLNLKRAAEIIQNEHGGTFPNSAKELVALPGIGPYTAAAVCVFAYNQTDVLIETNIRSVYLHHFFSNKSNIHDDEILPLVEKTLNRKNPRVWYWALMDYGAHLKKEFPNPGRRSAHHTVQSQFKDSNRQIRGHILKLLTQESPQTVHSLLKQTPHPTTKVEASLTQLLKEKLLTQKGQKIWLG